MWTVVITGVSRGLGAALFNHLYERGDRVIGVGRTFTEQQRSLADTAPDRVLLHHADLAEPATLPTAEQMRGWWASNGPTALVHNAGLVEPIGAIGELATEELVRSVTVNLTAPMVLTNTFLASAPPRPSSVLFISSGAAHRLVEGWACYSATKRGGEMYFDALAAQDPTVTVASISPGVMDTDMQARIRQAAADGVWFPGQQRFLNLHAEGALPSPREVAQTIVAEHLPAAA